MHNKKKFGFTLVELIIVIAIIATLSVIAVMTITEWIGKSRDTRRLADLGQIDKALDIAYTKNAEMPMPDSYVNVTASGTVIGYQGKFCDTAVAKTSIKTTPKDPMDDTCYSYYINADKNKFQIMGMLENDKKIAYESSRVIASNNLDQSKGVAILEEKIEPLTATRDINIGSGSSSETNLRNNSQGLLNSVFAADYSKRYPRVKGEKLGIIISSGTNQPIEDGGAAVDVVNTTSNYIAYYSDSSKVIGTGSKLYQIMPNTSCKKIYDMGNSKGDGIYSINPLGTGNVDVYCDMTTDGGGWTLVGINFGNTNPQVNITGSFGSLTSPTQSSVAKLHDDIWKFLSSSAGTKFIYFTSDKSSKLKTMYYKNTSSNEWPGSALICNYHRVSEDGINYITNTNNGCVSGIGAFWTISTPTATSIGVLGSTNTGAPGANWISWTCTAGCNNTNNASSSYYTTAWAK